LQRIPLRRTSAPFLWHFESKNFIVVISRRQFDALFLIDLVKAEWRKERRKNVIIIDKGNYENKERHFIFWRVAASLYKKVSRLRPACLYEGSCMTMKETELWIATLNKRRGNLIYQLTLKCVIWKHSSVVLRAGWLILLSLNTEVCTKTRISARNLGTISECP
jgi:hypothetical protein